MDQQSVNRLREELAAFIAWFTANFTVYFSSNYETPSQEYIERSRAF
jgi:mortality factor 4-like protein 1